MYLEIYFVDIRVIEFVGTFSKQFYPSNLLVRPLLLSLDIFTTYSQYFLYLQNTAKQVPVNLIGKNETIFIDFFNL